MANTDTAGALGGVAAGISGFTRGYNNAKDRKLKEKQVDAGISATEARGKRETTRAAEQTEQHNWLRDLNKTKEGQATLKREHMAPGVSYSAARTGNQAFAIKNMNQYRAEDNQITDMSVAENGDLHWTENTPEGPKEVVIPVNRILPLAEAAVPGLLEARKVDKYGGRRGGGKADPYADQEALSEIGNYINVERKSSENTDGITAGQEAAVIKGWNDGKSLGEIMRGLKIKRKGVDEIDTLDTAVKAAEVALQGINRRSKRWLSESMGSVGEKEGKQIAEAETTLQTALQSLEKMKEFLDQDLSSIKKGAVAVPETQGIAAPPTDAGIGVATLPQQQLPPEVANSRTLTPENTPITFESIDENQDGKLDEQDEKVRAAIWAEENPDLVTDPLFMEEAKATLKIYRANMQKSKEIEFPANAGIQGN